MFSKGIQDQNVKHFYMYGFIGSRAFEHVTYLRFVT